MEHVPPEGSPLATIAFVGEAPSYNEVVQGRPFVGQAGQQFNNYLVHARIIRAEVYITNVFKVQVSKKGGDLYIKGELVYKGGKGFTDAGLVHRDALLAELKETAANVVVSMGEPAMFALTGKTGITKRRGSILFNSIIKKKVIPTIHPAAALRQYMWRHRIIIDFRRARVEGESPEYNPPTRNYLLSPSFRRAAKFLWKLRYEEHVAFDIEVVNEEVSCISFSDSPKRAACIPFHSHGSPYFTYDQEAEIWRLIAGLLADEKVEKVGQNLSFDTAFLFDRYGITVRPEPHDTMIGQRIAFPDFPMGLDFITSTRTKEPYYKDEGKKHFKIGGPEEDFWLYNAKDSVVCMEALPSILDDLKRLGNVETYNVHRRLIEPTVYMGYRGLRVDVKGLATVREEAEEKSAELQEQLNKIVGHELNPNSPKQVATHFYVDKRIKPYMKKGAVTTEEGALKRIARRGYPEARLILQIRHLQKMIGTYYSVVLRDERLCCSYTPVTDMGRLSSSKDIFGRGMNMQNQPAEMNRFFLADPGCLLYNVDLSQADNRSVAYIAPEPRMIQAFETGVDLHALTANLIYKIPVDEIITMNKEDVKCQTGYGDQTHRHWGKKCNHALNYGMGYKLFSYRLELIESEGRSIWDLYHAAYPGIQHSYHQWVRNKLSKDRSLTNAFGRTYLFLDRWGEPLFNQAYSFIPQSNTADIINRLGIIPIYYSRVFNNVEILRQVHDSINFQLPISSGLDEHMRVLRAIKAGLEQPIRWKTYEFIIPAEFKVGLRLDPMVGLDVDGKLEEQLLPYFSAKEKVE